MKRQFQLNDKTLNNNLDNFEVYQMILFSNSILKVVES